MKKIRKKVTLTVIILMLTVSSISLPANAAVVQRYHGKFWAKMSLARNGATISKGTYHSIGVSWQGAYIRRNSSISWRVKNKSYDMYINGIYNYGPINAQEFMDLKLNFANFY